MKKILLTVLVLFAVTGAVFAQDAGTVSVGARAGGVIGFHDFEDMGGGNTLDSKFNFVIGAFGAYTIIDNLSIQAELNFMIGQGGEKTISGYDIESRYNSLDIPLLIKYSFLNAPLVVGAEAGPQLSIPIGKVQMDDDGSGWFPDEADIDGITFGAVAGIYAGYPLGPGRVTGDLRFLFDFNVLKVKMGGSSEDALTRRGFIFAIGYEISF